jgi:hypothetical protein
MAPAQWPSGGEGVRIRTMRIRRRRDPDLALEVTGNEADDPLSAADSVIRSIGKKAEKNKRRARAAVLFLATSSATIPLALVASTKYLSFFLGKILPAALAAIAAIVATWLEIERPHQRWTLYKRFERLFEAERLRYKHKLGKYGGADADGLFWEVLAEGQLQLHDEWAGLIPQSSELAPSLRSELR